VSKKSTSVPVNITVGLLLGTKGKDDKTIGFIEGRAVTSPEKVLAQSEIY